VTPLDSRLASNSELSRVHNTQYLEALERFLQGQSAAQRRAEVGE